VWYSKQEILKTV